MTMREEFEQWLLTGEWSKAGDARGWDGVAEVTWKAAYAAGQRAGREEEREECAQAVEAEAVDAQETGAEGDHAYNRALEHAATAIRNRSNA